MQLTTNLLIGSFAAMEIGTQIIFKELIKSRSSLIID